MRRRSCRLTLLSLALLSVLLLSGCGMLAAMEYLSPQAISDAFEPYQSASPDGQWLLDVRKVEETANDDTTMSFAAIRVLSAGTGEVLYDCPDRWRFWDLHGIDWLCDGTIAIYSTDMGLDYYGPGANGEWQRLNRFGSEYAPFTMTIAPIYDDGCARIYERYGWRTVEAISEGGGSYISYDAEGKERLNMVKNHLTLAELETLIAENGANAGAYSMCYRNADGTLRYLTADLYSVTIRDFAIASADPLPL